MTEVLVLATPLLLEHLYRDAFRARSSWRFFLSPHLREL